MGLHTTSQCCARRAAAPLARRSCDKVDNLGCEFGACEVHHAPSKALSGPWRGRRRLVDGPTAFRLSLGPLCILGGGKREKIEWLGAQGLLPLPRHQAYGSIFVKTLRVAEGYNPISQTSAKTLRGVIEHLDGPVLELARKDQLFPIEDTLDEK